MAEYIEREKKDESICRSCFHSYVCEKFNAHRGWENDKCLFFNDHFAPAADVVEVCRCQNCIHSKYFEESGIRNCLNSKGFYRTVTDNDFCSYGEPKGERRSE